MADYNGLQPYDVGDYENEFINLLKKLNMKTEISTKQKTANSVKGAVSGSLSNKDVLLIKEKILHCLADDFKGNQAIFDRKEGWQVFNGTDLEMVMDSVIKGLKFAQAEINCH
jgi:hypothetical protein